MFSKKTEYKAFESMPLLTAGYQLLLPGLNLTVPRVFIGAGKVDVTRQALTKPGVIDLRKEQEFQFTGYGQINYAGPAGIGANNFSFEYLSSKLQLNLGGISTESMNGFADAVFDQMYSAALKQFQPPFVSEINKQCKLKLEDLKQWDVLPNQTPGVLSFAPNALNSQQARKQVELPQYFTIMALVSKDKKYALVYRGVIWQGLFGATVELVMLPSKKQKFKSLYLLDVSHNLPDLIPYFYTTYWENRFDAPNKNQLRHILLSPGFNSNSIILPCWVDESGIQFNEEYANDELDNAIAPIIFNIGLVPTANNGQHKNRPKHTV